MSAQRNCGNCGHVRTVYPSISTVALSCSEITRSSVNQPGRGRAAYIDSQCHAVFIVTEQFSCALWAPKEST